MDAFAYPIAIVVIAFLFMIFFRKEVSALIHRIKIVGPVGIEPSTSEPPQRIPDAKTSATDELMRALDSASLRKNEDAITGELNKRGISGEDAVKVLTRYLASSQLVLSFERINQTIFGSQIRLLETLNTSPKGEPEDTLKQVYQIAANQYADLYQHYSFESYIEYLFETGLVTRNNTTFFITQFGREFLVYLTSTGQTTFKQY